MKLLGPIINHRPVTFPVWLPALPIVSPILSICFYLAHLLLRLVCLGFLSSLLSESASLCFVLFCFVLPCLALNGITLAPDKQQQQQEFLCALHIISSHLICRIAATRSHLYPPFSGNSSSSSRSSSRLLVVACLLQLRVLQFRHSNEFWGYPKRSSQSLSSSPPV